MHIEIQVALNFVISYLYNKLPRRRVNIFGEELEKALKDKFQGHWYPEKPFKGSAFRCLKTGDPIDSVLERAARESGVPIADILENLPAELSVWVDPGEVSYRIGEKGVVKILYSENSDNHEDNTSADREVNKTFNPEAQCFRPIDAVNTSMNSLSLSPKTSPQTGSSPHSASSNSPTYKGSPNPAAATANGSFLQRTQAPLTFTTATFAQTKFGSTKLKTSSKRTNSSSSYRMSPTEFSNYIKQRAMQQQQQQQQQQIHHGGPNVAQPQNHFGPIGPVSPARSLSPNPMSLGLGQNNANADPFYFSNMASMGMYPQFNGHRNVFDAHFHAADNNGLYGGGSGGAGPTNTTNGVHGGKFNNYLDPHGFYGLGGNQHLQQSAAAAAAAAAAAHQQHQQHQQQSQMTLQPSQHQQSVVGSPISAQHQQQQQQQQQANGNIKNIVVDKSAAATDNPTNGGNNKSNNIITVTVSNGNGGNANEATTNTTNNSNTTTPTAISPSPLAAAAAAAVAASAAAAAAANSNNQQQQQQQDSNNSKLIDGLNSFYSNATGPYQQLLVAN